MPFRQIGSTDNSFFYYAFRFFLFNYFFWRRSTKAKDHHVWSILHSLFIFTIYYIIAICLWITFNRLVLNYMFWLLNLMNCNFFFFIGGYHYSSFVLGLVFLRFRNKILLCMVNLLSFCRLLYMLLFCSMFCRDLMSIYQLIIWFCPFLTKRFRLIWLVMVCVDLS